MDDGAKYERVGFAGQRKDKKTFRKKDKKTKDGQRGKI